MEIDFLFTRGDTFSFTFELEDFSGDLDTCYFSCKEDVEDKNYTFQKKLGDGIEKVTDNQYRVRLDRSDTINMIVGMPYYHDVEIGIRGDYLTIISGKIKLKQDITRIIEGE